MSIGSTKNKRKIRNLPLRGNREGDYFDLLKNGTATTQNGLRTPLYQKLVEDTRSIAKISQLPKETPNS